MPAPTRAPDAPLDAFVIYTRPDRDRARALVDALRAEGRATYWDQDLVPGDAWDVELPRALRRARVVLVVISPIWPAPGAATSDGWYARDEIAATIARVRRLADPPRLVPVVFDGAHDRIHYGLSHLVSLDVTTGQLDAALPTLAPAFGAAAETLTDAPGALAAPGVGAAPPPLADPILAHRVVEHPRHRARLAGFRRFLTEAHLPFQAPPAGDPTHPDTIWGQMRDHPADRGVLLYGAGGVGKTRTAYEVAERADAAGWRVLHVDPSDGVLDAHALVDALAARPHPTLLVFDYLDQLHEFDHGALHRRRPALAAPLALLANARPLWVDEHRTAWLPLFEAREVAPDAAQRVRLLATIATHAAPTALAHLGHSRLATLCGDRPIVALLIALQLEQRAAEGALDPDTLSRARDGDLLWWLGDRLDRDGVLRAVTGSPLAPPSVDPHQLAAAAALTAAPQAVAGLTDAADATLTACGVLTPAGGYLVGVLRRMGWLEADGLDLRTAHDVVADEACQQSLAPRGQIVAAHLDALLAGALRNPRHLGRFALALTRSQTSSADDRYPAALTAAATKWWTAHIEALRGVLLGDEPDVASYALGAVLGGSIWQRPALDGWRDVVGPWLDHHGLDVHARHLLYQGLRAVPDDQIDALVTASLRWLDAHPVTPTATFVLGPLLQRLPVDGPDTRAAIAAARRWLSEGDNTWVLTAQFVLYALLRRPDLTPDHASAAIRHALAWLDHPTFSLSPEARFVLYALLGRPDLTPHHATTAVRYALAWLDRPALTFSPDARFVLAPLLARPDLTPDHSSMAVRHALAWLDRPTLALSPEAQFILHALLARPDLTPDHAKAAIHHALAWLNDPTLAFSPEAQFVLSPLIARPDLTPGHAAATTRHALAWLSRPVLGLSPDAQFVLNSLLARPDLTLDHATAAIRHALAWLGHPPLALSPDAQFVLKHLIARRDLTAKDHAYAIAHARRWLTEHGTSLDAGYVLRPLLENAEEPWMLERAAVWVAEHGAAPQAGFVYTVYLRKKQVPDAVLIGAARWLVAHRTDSDIDFVFSRLMAKPALSDPAWLATAAIALDWLDHAPLDAGFVYALENFDHRPHLLTHPQRQRWAEHARRMLRARVKAPMKIIKHIVELGERIEYDELPDPPC